MMRWTLIILLVLGIGCGSSDGGGPNRDGASGTGGDGGGMGGAGGSADGATPEADATAEGGAGDAESATTDCAQLIASGGRDFTFDVPGYTDRAYDLHLPEGYACDHPLPVVVAFHGGGGNKEGQRKLGCPDGALDSPGCLHHIGDVRGFATVFPNGTGTRLVPDHRTWNAGGGQDGFICVSGNACQDNLDDIAYTRRLLDELARHFPVDADRVYATGMSNGAGFANRLGCELADRIAAIAPVSGANQFETATPCAPARRVAVLHTHGTADPCWVYMTGNGGCLESGRYIGVEPSIADWAARNGCGATPAETSLPDLALDGTHTLVETYPGCADGADVVLYKVVGGGHRWPGGWLYPSLGIDVGIMSRDFNASRAIADFLLAHPRR
jgi:polyhydroxybutyrate depolymerase